MLIINYEVNKYWFYSNLPLHLPRWFLILKHEILACINSTRVIHAWHESFFESAHVYERDNDRRFTNFRDPFKRSEARVNSL